MNWLIIFSLIMSLGFAFQAVKLRQRRDWLVAANVVFSVLYLAAAFYSLLRIPVGLLTVAAFVRPSVDRSKSMQFRIAHIAVLVLALIYVALAF